MYQPPGRPRHPIQTSFIQITTFSLNDHPTRPCRNRLAKNESGAQVALGVLCENYLDVLNVAVAESEARQDTPRHAQITLGYCSNVGSFIGQCIFYFQYRIKSYSIIRSNCLKMQFPNSLNCCFLYGIQCYFNHSSDSNLIGNYDSVVDRIKKAMLRFPKVPYCMTSDSDFRSAQMTK